MRGGGGDEANGQFPGIFGGEGHDKLFGGPGDDFMPGDEGNDRLFGEDDEDRIDAATNESPGSTDVVDCGEGVDEVIANRNDRVAADGDRVERVPNATSGAAAEAKRAGDAEQARVREAFRECQAAKAGR